MNRTVTVIPARRRKGNRVAKEERPKLKVAAYCRVSTDSDEQATSYEAQVEHYREFISKNDEWEFAGIYADDGISGTNTKKREEFNRLIEDCLLGKIDMVITKSISRFARNTLDCLKYIRELKDKNIAVFFEKENINTLDSKGEVLLTIMASLAQQESESLSKNVKLGLQFRYQNGQIQINHNRFLGYTKDEDGKLVIEPEEAEVVKRIYYEYLQGASLKNIAEGLEKDGILTGAGRKTWRAETVRGILCNEKYAGDALLQKTYTVDVLNKKRIANNGIVPQYYVENSHEAIIPKNLFMQVQAEMQRRTNLRAGKGNKQRHYSSKYALSGIVYCSKCEDVYRRISLRNNGKPAIVWKCITRAERGPLACYSEIIKEPELHQAVVDAINQVIGSRDEMLEILEQNIEATISENDENEVERIDEELESLQTELLKKANAHQDYDDLADEIDRLREEKENILKWQANQEEVKRRIETMREFLNNHQEELNQYDDQLVRRMIEKITIYDERFEFKFKSGINLDVER